MLSRRRRSTEAARITDTCRAEGVARASSPALVSSRVVSRHARCRCALSPFGEALPFLGARFVLQDRLDIRAFDRRERPDVEAGIRMVPVLTREVRLQMSILERAPVTREDL